MYYIDKIDTSYNVATDGGSLQVQLRHDIDHFMGEDFALVLHFPLDRQKKIIVTPEQFKKLLLDIWKRDCKRNARF